MNALDRSLWAVCSPEEYGCVSCGELIKVGEGVVCAVEGPRHFPGCNEAQCREWMDSLSSMKFDFARPTDTEGGEPT